MVITGPPRSGTSILFELLSLDPERPRAAGLGGHPSRALRRALARARLLREIAECEQEFWADVQPEFATIHELRADLPGRVRDAHAAELHRRSLGHDRESRELGARLSGQHGATTARCCRRSSTAVRKNERGC